MKDPLSVAIEAGVRMERRRIRRLIAPHLRAARVVERQLTRNLFSCYHDPLHAALYAIDAATKAPRKARKEK